MKRFTALLLAALIVIGVSGCGTEPAPTTAPADPTAPSPTDPTVPVPADEPFDPEVCRPLFGVWRFTIGMDGTLMALPEFDGGTEFHIVWTFSEDGTYSIDPDYRDAVTEFEAELVDYMVEHRYQIFVSECRLEGKGDWYVENEWVTNGLGEEVRAEVTDTVESLGLTRRYAPLSRAGDYYMDGGRLYLRRDDGSYETFACAVDGDTMTLTDSNDVRVYQNMGLRFPLILTAVVDR